MPGTTRLFGLILIVLGITSYSLTGRTSLTAMIPAFFGAAFLVCAMVARKESMRKHAMHVAVAVAETFLLAQQPSPANTGVRLTAINVATVTAMRRFMG